MRLKTITLSGFRAFAKATTVDLAADCTILIGKNGQGKTSLLDGLFWALTGKLERIGEDESVVSLYSETGGAEVIVTLAGEDADLSVRRRFDGYRTTLVCRLGDRTLDREELRLRYGALIGLPEESSAKSEASTATKMARSLYLQQDSIRDFISADTDDSRFRVVADLCGLGRATDLQVALQRERKAWSQATNSLQADARAIQRRVGELAGRLTVLGAASDGSDAERELSEEWEAWWGRVRSAGLPVTDTGVELTASDGSAGLERGIQQLDHARGVLERRQAGLREAIRKARIVAGDRPAREAPLREALEKAQREEAERRDVLRAAEARNSAATEKQLRDSVAAEEVRTLAELARRHLRLLAKIT